MLFCGEDEDRDVPNAGLSDRDDALRRLLFSGLWEWSGKGSVSNDGLPWMDTSSLSVCSVRVHGAEANLETSEGTNIRCVRKHFMM